MQDKRAELGGASDNRIRSDRIVGMAALEFLWETVEIDKAR